MSFEETNYTDIEDRQRCCACNRDSSKKCQFASYTSLAVGVGFAFGIYFVLRCNPAEEEWCRFKNNGEDVGGSNSEYATLILLVLLFTIGILFLFVRSRFNPGMWNEESEAQEPPDEPKPPEYEFIMESDMNMFARMKIMDPDIPPPTIRSAIKQPKVSDYKPPDFNETFGHPPDYAESTGIFECDSEGKSMLDNGSFLGSTSMFGSSMLNSRNDMSTSNYSLGGTSHSRFSIARLTGAIPRHLSPHLSRIRTTSDNRGGPGGAGASAASRR